MHKDISIGKWKPLHGQGKEWGELSTDDLLTNPDVFHYIMVKKWWGRLTDDELEHVSGKYDKFIGLFQEKYEDTQEKK